MGGHARAALLALGLLGACSTPALDRQAGSSRDAFDRVCTPATRARHATDVEAAGRVGAPPTAPGPSGLPGFSTAATDVAEVIGALPLLEALSRSGPPRTPETGAEALRRLRLRQAITEKVTLAMLDVSSTLAVIDCEGERGDALRARLQAAETRRARRLGLASILLGAATAALSGGLSLGGAAAAGDVAGIVGGSAEASTATALLFGEESGELRTERNLLREVWEQPPRSELFPRTVWRYLTRRPAEGAEARSRVETLSAEWQAGGPIGPRHSEDGRRRAALLFGAGGTYTVEELEMRDAMLDLLEANIALMNEDLRVLLIELVEWPGAATEAAVVAAPAGGRGRHP